MLAVKLLEPVAWLALPTISPNPRMPPSELWPCVRPAHESHPQQDTEMQVQEFCHWWNPAPAASLRTEAGKSPHEISVLQSMEKHKQFALEAAKT